MQKIAARTPVVWGMTGSPITTGAMDAYGLAKVVNSKRLPSQYMTKFRNLVMYQLDMYNYEHKPGWEKIVFNTLQPAIQFKTEDCIDLPDISYETRALSMADETKKAYKDMLDHQIHELEHGTITAVNAGVKYSKLLQIASGTVYDEDGQVIDMDVSSKVNELEMIVYESGKKLIVFVQFVQSAIRVTKELRKRGFSVAAVYGDVNPKMRTRIFDEFQNGSLQVLVAQVSTASHGLTLTASNYIVFWSAIMGVEKFIQSIARIRRAGQARPQHIIKFVSCRAEIELFKKLETGKLTNDDILDLYKNL